MLTDSTTRWLAAMLVPNERSPMARIPPFFSCTSALDTRVNMFWLTSSRIGAQRSSGSSRSSVETNFCRSRAAFRRTSSLLLLSPEGVKKWDISNHGAKLCILYLSALISDIPIERCLLRSFTLNHVGRVHGRGFRSTCTCNVRLTKTLGNK